MHARTRTVTHVTNCYLFVAMNEDVCEQNGGLNFLSFAEVRRMSVSSPIGHLRRSRA
jgi:hypothetical protein